MVKACIYSRVSSVDQTTENQIPVLKKWALDRGWQLVEIYQENETAWKSGHQKKLAELLADARRGKFQVLLVWSLDRLSREGALAILSLIHRLASYGVKVLSHQELWTDAPGELAELLFALSGWVAKMESHRRSERTKAGLVRAASQGKQLGRPKGAKDKRTRKKRSAKLSVLSAWGTG